jgi:tetratricopeptide (TPR) repeat protein
MKRVLLAALLGATACMSTEPRPAAQAGPAASAPAVGAPASPAPSLGELRRVGTVHFATSCDPRVADDFLRGVALLHSFFYEEARRVFEAVAAADPSCAMAEWGVAMTYYHPIWAPPTPADMDAGREALHKAVTMGAQTERERDFIAALDAFYATPVPAGGTVGQSCHGPGGGHTPRAVAYTKAMERVHAKYPRDDEAAAFYALALLGSAPAADPTLANQLGAAAILEELWKTHHDHPGVAHYLIHAYDFPPLAPRGLEAARAYASIAPWVPHALHMPSHIFTRLGLWQEGIDANLASAEAAREYARQHHPSAASFEELHALDYLVYAYLQTEQDAKAKGLVDHVAAMQRTYPEIDFAAGYALGAIPARYALERRAWGEAAALVVPHAELPAWSAFPFDEGHLQYARALGCAHVGDEAGARAALDRMAALRDAVGDARFEYFKAQLDLQRAAVTAVLAYRASPDEAIARLRETADAEDRLGKHPVSPGAIVPVRELLGDALLDAKRPAEALVAFDGSLAIYPARFASLYGAAHAAELAGKKDVARRRYTELLTSTRSGDGHRPELAHARAFLVP